MAVNPIGPVAADPNPYAHSGSVAPTVKPQVANLSSAQTGNGASTHQVDRADYRGPSVLRIVSTVGATPTVTVAIEGSMDNTDWYALPHAADLTAAPATGNLTITTATTTRRFLPTGHAWRYLRLNYTANTNVTLTADLLV